MEVEASGCWCREGEFQGKKFFSWARGGGGGGGGMMLVSRSQQHSPLYGPANPTSPSNPVCETFEGQR